MNAPIRPALLLASALLATSATAAEPQPPANPLQPLASFAGHCFKGTLAGGKDTDEHCFQWMLGGKALRDVHTLRGAAHPDYVGETTYYWDSAARRIEYLYVESGGGVMRGTVEPAEGVIVFPPTAYVAEGRSLTLRVRWTLAPDGYEAWSEIQDQGAWATMFRVRMARAS